MERAVKLIKMCFPTELDVWMTERKRRWSKKGCSLDAKKVGKTQI